MKPQSKAQVVAPEIYVRLSLNSPFLPPQMERVQEGECKSEGKD
jgi:hypothetical protein